MNKMTQEELDIKLKLHREWLIDDEKGERLDLSGVDLRGTDLRHANLKGAYLRNTNLTSAELSYTNLKYANLGGTDLRHANLKHVNLRGACLINTNLTFADLGGACLSEGTLLEANLLGADLSGADLEDTKMYVANSDYITGVNLVRISNVGSNNRGVVYDVDRDIVYCGCWTSDLEEFKTRIDEVYGVDGSNTNEQYYEEYQNVIRHFETKKKWIKEVKNESKL